MRPTIEINLNNSLLPINAGIVNEHNAQPLEITVPTVITDTADYCRVIFDIGTGIVPSERFDVPAIKPTAENPLVINTNLVQDVTQKKYLAMWVSGYTLGGDYLGKTQSVTLVFSGGESGDVVAGGREPYGVVIEVEKNTAARHTHDNMVPLGKLNEDADGDPTYDGKRIGGNITVQTCAELPETADEGTQAVVLHDITAPFEPTDFVTGEDVDLFLNPYPIVDKNFTAEMTVPDEGYDDDSVIFTADTVEHALKAEFSVTDEGTTSDIAFVCSENSWHKITTIAGVVTEDLAISYRDVPTFEGAFVSGANLTNAGYYLSEMPFALCKAGTYYFNGVEWVKDEKDNGLWNLETGDFSHIGAGGNNTTTGDFSHIGAGGNNTTTGDFSHIGAGGNNTTTGDASHIGAGGNNTTTGDFSHIGAGGNNTTTGDFSHIGAGGNNTTTGDFSHIGAGANNTTTGDFSHIGAGSNNTTTGDASHIGAGSNNTTTGDFSHIGAGISNTTTGDFSHIGAGSNNTTTGDFSHIGAGISNTTTGDASHIGAGENNETVGRRSAITGGIGNTANGEDGTVVGRYGESSATSLFAIGNGKDSGRRSLAAECTGELFTVNVPLIAPQPLVMISGYGAQIQTDVVNYCIAFDDIEFTLPPIPKEGTAGKFELWVQSDSHPISFNKPVAWKNSVPYAFSGSSMHKITGFYSPMYGACWFLSGESYGFYQP